MSGGPDFERVASILFRVALRMSINVSEAGKGEPGAHCGVLSRVNRRTGRGGFLDRGTGGADQQGRLRVPH